MAKKDLNAQDIQRLYTMSMEMMRKLRSVLDNLDVHTHNVAVRIFAAIAIIGFFGTGAYYVFTDNFMPFLLFIGISVPSLAGLLIEQAKVTANIADEYEDYSDAMSALLAAMTTASQNMVDDDITQAIAAALSAATTVPVEKTDEIMLGDLRVMPQYQKALVMSKQLVAIHEAAINLEKEGLDVNKILETLDIDPKEFLEEVDLENLRFEGLPLVPGPEHQEVPLVPFPDDETKSDPHIIPVNDDDDSEDLSIVV